MRDSAIDRAFGRRAYGSDPAGYDAARPGYPEWVFDFLRQRCGLASGTAIFEIGAGTGKATRQLIHMGANPLVAIEPDERMAGYLRERIQDAALTVIDAPFEEVTLPESSFDLGVSASAFHWLDENVALTKVARLLRPGGWWAMFWNVFGDPRVPDPFHEATNDLLGPPLNSPPGHSELPSALDAEGRRAALERAGAFDGIEHRVGSWPLTLDTEQTVALYATYSNVIIRLDREDVLKELRRIVRDEFGDRVTRNVVTSLYAARRRP
jgi:SAM-dependent methyltransferase